MKQLALISIIGLLVFTGCEDKKSDIDNEAQGKEIITHDIDAAGALGFYYNFLSEVEVDSSNLWHISFQMISVTFGQSTYMMPSLVLGESVYAAEYSDVTFNDLETTPGTFMSDYFQDPLVVQYSGTNEVLQYDMQSHTVSVKNPDRVFVVYDSINHTTFKIQFIEYVSGIISFRYIDL